MERIDNKKFLEKILTSEDVVSNINDNLDYLLFIIPEISYMIGFEHKHPHHHLDVWNHTLLALSLSENDLKIRLVLLLHDIGKPFSYQESLGIRHYKNHSEMSSKIANNILNRFNYEDSFIQDVCYLIETHDEEISKKEIKENLERSIIKYKIQYCDALAHNPNNLEKRKQYLYKINKYIVDKSV